MELTKDQLEVLAYTVLGEAAGEGFEGMAAVAHVLQNRSESGRFPADPSKAATQASQFSTWNDGAGGNDPKSRYSKDSDIYKSAEKAVLEVFGGKHSDPTGGATHYWAPNGMAGGSDPYWADSETTSHGRVKIGGHVFLARKAPSTASPASNVQTQRDEQSLMRNRDIPEAPARRPETVGGVPVKPLETPAMSERAGDALSPARNTVLTSRSVKTNNIIIDPATGAVTMRPETPKAPVAGLKLPVALAPASAAAKPIVPALGKTVAQIGQEADNSRLNGQRALQEMGPKGAPAAKAAITTKPAAPKLSGAVRVNTEYVRPNGSSTPVTPAGGGSAMPARKTTVLTGGKSPDARDEAAAAKKTAPLPAPAKLEFSKPVYKTVTVLNPAWKAGDPLTGGKSPDERDEQNAASAAISSLAVSRFIQKRVLVAPAKAISVEAGQTAARNAAIAAQNKKIAATNAAKKAAAVSITVLGGGGSGPAARTPAGNLHPGAAYDNNGNDMAYMPKSYQNNPRNSNGGY